MKKIQLYAANLLSLDCEESARIYSKLFSFQIITCNQNHAELKSETGFTIFLDRPSLHCKVQPGSISFSIFPLNINELDLKPLELESHYKKENYASYLDKYSNRIWVFEKE